ncbi:gamma-aminobutyric acid receptor subunit rho-2 isoform X4 [Fundulus heteroclitus]|uniref:gamma-aminobutyric acid receptor subunit rho-2 isoform X4 n=1 Tax=Fundulus heteroclitus TaxID=8078 RepID=UPI00165BAC38|nr:gamma-aminobutyric acid receptor subunit rho-2 isoform X4 [Fundulus heteroclitus]
MPYTARFLLLLLCLILTAESRRKGSRKRRWSEPEETLKPGKPLGETPDALVLVGKTALEAGMVNGHLSKKIIDGTKTRKLKTSHLLRVDEHDFTMRPAFAGPAVPVGVDVQVESLDSISEVDMDFTMTLYLRHYWKDERLAFPSATNKSMTFDGRLVKKIWVPDVFFVHSKRSFIHDTTTDNIMLRVFPDGHVLYSLRVTVTAACNMDFSRFPLDSQTCTLELESCITTVLTMSTIITGVNASMPRVSYIKAVDIYLWVSFVFVFLSVLEYAAVNYLTTVRDGKDRKLREKMREQSQTLPCTCGMPHTKTMMLDGMYSEADANSLAGYTRASMAVEDPSDKQEQMVVHLALDNESIATKKKGIRSFSIIQNTHTIDTYSRMIFPGAYILFNLIYWCVYC